MPQHSAILRSPPHTRPRHPRANLVAYQTDDYDWRCLSSVPRLRPGGSDRSRLASCQRAPRTKPDFWNAQTKRHSTETCRISLIQNLEKQSRNPRFIQHLHTVWHTAGLGVFDNSTRSEMNDMKLQHLLTIQTSHGQRMSKTWHHDMLLHSTETTTHQALAPSAPIWFCPKLMFVNGPVYLQCLGQGLEAATDQGWRLVRGPFGQNLISEMLKQKDIQLRHVESLWFKTWKNNPEIQGFIQHLHTVWHTAGLGVFDNSTRSEMNDMKLQHLLTIQTSHW